MNPIIYFVSLSFNVIFLSLILTSLIYERRQFKRMCDNVPTFPDPKG